MNTEPLEIQIWSDIACPWCWVGKKNLETALADVDAEVRVHWRAFELNPMAPDTPPDAVDYAARLAAKYHMSRQDAQGFIDRMTAAGAERGIEFRFDRIRPCNTFNAHRLLAWARESGKQNDLKERFFRAYMNEGLDLNDGDTLCRLAADIGLDAEAAAALLASEAHGDSVRGDQDRARQSGVNGVPFFDFGFGITASGAQPPAVLRNALLRVRELRASEESQSSTADALAAVCGVDGCSD